LAQGAYLIDFSAKPGISANAESGILPENNLGFYGIREIAGMGTHSWTSFPLLFRIMGVQVFRSFLIFRRQFYYLRGRLMEETWRFAEIPFFQPNA